MLGSFFKLPFGALGISFNVLLGGHEAWAVFSERTTAELPQIQAKAFRVLVVARSHSGKIYLLKDLDLQKPVPGHILLLKKKDMPVMGFRILKNYPGTEMIAVKRVKKYPDVDFLEESDLFTALEKITDLKLSDPTAIDREEMTQLERSQKLGPLPEIPLPPTPEVLLPPPSPSHAYVGSLDQPLAFDPEVDELQKYDPELDQDSHFQTVPRTKLTQAPPSPTPPPPEPEPGPEPKPSPSPTPEAQASPTVVDPFPQDSSIDEEDEVQALTYEEKLTFERFNHWVTVGFGSIRNSAKPGSAGTLDLSGGNVRYGINVASGLFTDTRQLQDSLTLEGGFYLYKALSYAVQSDAYTIASLAGTIRYNLYLSRSLIGFVYAGLIQGRVLSASNASDAAISLLSRTFPAGGVGFFFEMGPNWYMRVDLGYDTVSGNLVLRF